MIYPPASSNKQWYSKDNSNPDECPEVGIDEVVKTPVCKGKVPVSIKIDDKDKENSCEKGDGAACIGAVGFFVWEEFFFFVLHLLRLRKSFPPEPIDKEEKHDNRYTNVDKFPE